MSVNLPTHEQLRGVAEEIGFSLTDSDIESYIGLLTSSIEAYKIIDAMPDNLPEVKYPRKPGYRPEGEENKYNAWYYKTTVEGASKGKLKGKTLALKDTVMLAGVPMMNGASTLEGYVPNIDATIVSRILDAGGTIVGKAHCEEYSLSGCSNTNATGPIHNPHKIGYSAGGSSSGSAVLAAIGEVDMAIGGDQGGSIRIPSSVCGAYGMKPTHGLVPYTGIMPIEIYIDHAGPISGNVKNNALLLEVIAGPDGYDPRQYDVVTNPYSEMLDGGVSDMKIAMVTEGFGQEYSDPEIDAKVRAAAENFRKIGATVNEISIPWHLLGGAVWIPIGVGGLAQTMIWGDSFGLSRPDLYVLSLMDVNRGWRQRANELKTPGKLFLMLGAYIKKYYGCRHYGKAMNISRVLRAAYDAVLAQYNLLLMPTTPIKATPLPGPDASLEEHFNWTPIMQNTAPFNITHHPAMSIPCGMIDELPIGMMLIGKHFDESTIYKAAYAFEQAEDWKSL